MARPGVHRTRRRRRVVAGDDLYARLWHVVSLGVIFSSIIYFVGALGLVD